MVKKIELRARLCYNCRMEQARAKAFAKLNLTLSVTGVKDGYHMLDSVVTSVDLFDTVAVKRRRDGLVGITMHGCGSESIPPESNNAYLAAQAFVDEFSTDGCEITVYKNIPIGLGLGGSSADAAGVINALAKLYNVGDRIALKRLADRNGSDTKYMLGGGYARLTGRGDEVAPLESNLKLHFLLLAPRGRVSTAQCFKVFDEVGSIGGDSEAAVKAITDGDKYALARNMSNSLAPAAERLSDEVAEAFVQLKSFSPLAVNMTGSGSGVYALFENAEYCAYAKSRYRGNMTAYCLRTSGGKEII